MKNIVTPWKRRNARSCRGQAMVEFILVAGAIVLMCTIMGVFLYTFREHSGRVMDHIGSEYP